MENLIYGRKLQDGVAGKGSLVFYHVHLIHHPGESVSFEKERSSLSVYQSKGGAHQSYVHLEGVRVTATHNWMKWIWGLAFPAESSRKFQNSRASGNRDKALQSVGPQDIPLQALRSWAWFPQVKAWKSRLDQLAFKDFEKSYRFPKCPEVPLQAGVEVNTHRSKSTPSSLSQISFGTSMWGFCICICLKFISYGYKFWKYLEWVTSDFFFFFLLTITSAFPSRNVILFCFQNVQRSACRYSLLYFIPFSLHYPLFLLSLFLSSCPPPHPPLPRMSEWL